MSRQLIIVLFLLPFSAFCGANCTDCSTSPCGCGVFSCPSYTATSKRKYYEKGIVNGISSDLPYVDKDFIYGVFPLCPCTYMKTDASCNGLSTSGIYVGGEMDLRKTNDEYYSKFSSAGLSLYSMAKDLVASTTKRPYKYCTVDGTGVNSCLRTYNLAAIKAINDNYIDDMASQLAVLYDKLRENYTIGYKFAVLPRDIRTCIFLSHYVYQDITKYPTMWRAYVQQNWEYVVKTMISGENAAQSAITGMNYKRQRFLIEYASLLPCPTRNTSFTIIFLVDSNRYAAVNKIVSEFISSLSVNPYLGYSIFFSIVWQSTAGIHSFELSEMSSNLIKKFNITNCTTGSLSGMIDTANNIFAYKLIKSMNVLVYVGEQITSPEIVYKKFIYLERNMTLMYAIKTDDVYSFANMKLFARGSEVVYGLSEVSSLIEALDGWTNYTCHILRFVQGTYEYNAALENGQNSTKFFSYVGLTNEDLARNVTILVVPQSGCSIQVRYSTRYKYPGYYLRDGRASCINGVYTVSFSYTAIGSTTSAVSYYYSISSKYNQKITFTVIEGLSSLISPCSTGCVGCDMMGGDCTDCAKYYEYYRGNCTKAYTEDVVPISNQREHVQYPMFLVTFGLIIAGLVLACVISRLRLSSEKPHGPQ